MSKLNAISSHSAGILEKRISGSKTRTKQKFTMSGKVVLPRWLHMAPRQEKEFDQTPLNWRQHCKHIALNTSKRKFSLFSVAK
jgi:hypothetical protein